MSKSVLILAATSLGLGGVTVHLVKELRQSQATVATLQAEVTELKEQPRAIAPPPLPPPVVQTAPTAPQVPSTAPTQPATAAVAVLMNRGPVTSASAGDGARIPTREERMEMMRAHRERQRQLMKDPEYREAMRLQHSMSMRHSYPGVVEDLGLSQEQAEELFGLLAEQQLRQQDDPLFMGFDPETRPDPEAIQQQQRRFQERQKANEAELAALLGPQKMQAWKEYQSTLGVRHQLNQMRQTLAGRGLALQDDFTKPMLKVMAEEQQRAMNEWRTTSDGNRIFGTSSGVGFVAAPGVMGGVQTNAQAIQAQERHMERVKEQNRRLLDALSPYLTSEQRQAIEDEQRAQLKMQEAHMRMMRAQQEAQARGEVTTIHPESAFGPATITPVQ